MENTKEVKKISVHRKSCFGVEVAWIVGVGRVGVLTGLQLSDSRREAVEEMVICKSPGCESITAQRIRRPRRRPFLLLADPVFHVFSNRSRLIRKSNRPFYFFENFPLQNSDSSPKCDLDAVAMILLCQGCHKNCWKRFKIRFQKNEKAFSRIFPKFNTLSSLLHFFERRKIRLNSGDKRGFAQKWRNGSTSLRRNCSLQTYQ